MTATTTTTPTLQEIEQAAGEASDRLAALRAELTDTKQAIRAGRAGAEEAANLLQRERELQVQIGDAQRIHADRQGRLTVARRAARAAELRPEGEALALELRGAVAELLRVLAKIERLQPEMHAIGVRPEPILGVPHDFASKVRHAIRAAAPGARWSEAAPG